MNRQKRKRRKGSRERLLARRRMEIIIIIGCALLALVGGYGWSRTAGEVGTASVNEDVLAYEPLIEKYAKEYGVSSYVAVI